MKPRLGRRPFLHNPRLYPLFSPLSNPSPLLRRSWREASRQHAHLSLGRLRIDSPGRHTDGGEPSRRGSRKPRRSEPRGHTVHQHCVPPQSRKADGKRLGPERTQREEACLVADLRGIQGACPPANQACRGGSQGVVSRTTSVSQPWHPVHLLPNPFLGRQGHLVLDPPPTPSTRPSQAEVPPPGPRLLSLLEESPVRAFVFVAQSARARSTQSLSTFFPVKCFSQETLPTERREQEAKKTGSTHLDRPELFTLGQDKVHVLVIRQHLPDQRPSVVPEQSESVTSIKDGQELAR